MPHPPSTCTIEVDLTRVLWLTRGWRWDYVFLLKPLVGVGDAWANLRSRVFSGVAPAVVPYSVAGVAAEGNVRRGFVATTFLDPRRCDARGRAVTHHLIWFPPDESSARMVVPADWGPQLVAALAPAFDAVFGLDLSDQGDERDLDPIAEVRDAFAHELAHVPPLLRLSGPAVMVYVFFRPIGPMATKLIELPRFTPPSPYTRTRALLLWAAVFAALMLVGLLVRRAS